jgi:putative FmdB family regulatory protein
MPTYVYGPTSGHQGPRCDACRGQFEIVQRMSDESLTQCPQCGAPVQRLIIPPHIPSGWAMRQSSPDRMAKAGFVQYKRKGKGYYEKQFGAGPQTLGGGTPI